MVEMPEHEKWSEAERAQCERLYDRLKDVLLSAVEEGIRADVMLCVLGCLTNEVIKGGTPQDEWAEWSEYIAEHLAKLLARDAGKEVRRMSN
jgi:hypothetical protein